MKKWNEISPFTGSSIGEDAPTNSAGSGSVAGLGVGPMGEPGVDPKKKKRKQPLIDGRSKAYRQHRERLEKARIKRQESKKNRGDFVESIVSEMTYGVGSLPSMRPQADMAMGYIVDSDDIDSKVASGPKKPSSGKTNKYILGTNKKQNLHVQVANLDNKRYELNMYVD
jgi:hypothetical protein